MLLHELWTGALDNLAHSLGATACQILPHELSQRPLGQIRSSHAWRIHERWQKNLDWVTPVYEPRGDPLVRQGYRAVLQSQLFSDDEIRHSRFHQEITRPVGCLHWACGIFQVEDRIWCLPFFRGNEQFGEDILEPIAEIAGRMARIVSLAEKVSRAEAQNEVLTLDNAGCAAMLIDKRGQVGRVNRRAEELFSNEFGIRNARLWAAATSCQARLERFMRDIEHAKSIAAPLPAPIVIARRSTPWLLIEAMPVTSAGTDIFRRLPGYSHGERSRSTIDYRQSAAQHRFWPYKRRSPPSGRNLPRATTSTRPQTHLESAVRPCAAS